MPFVWIATIVLGLGQLLILVWLVMVMRVQFDQLHARLVGLEQQWKKLTDALE